MSAPRISPAKPGLLLSTVKSVSRELLPPELLGRLDYYRFPKLKRGFGGPFNGQEGRRAIFHAVLEKCDFAAVIETGTYRGTTTEYMAECAKLPTFTVELDRRIAGYAKARLRRFLNVKVLSMDSRAAIRHIPPSVGTPFCYLDAHWNDDLPLGDEVDMILHRWPEAVIMVDDFEVPDDPGYAYDDYGPSKKLCLQYLCDSTHIGCSFFFPTLHSSQETGLRRGCVVLAKSSTSNVDRLALVPQLRQWQPTS